MIQQQVCLVDFLSVTLSLSDLVFCAFTDVAGSLSQSDLVFCAFTDVAGSLSQSDLVFVHSQMSLVVESDLFFVLAATPCGD